MKSGRVRKTAERVAEEIVNDIVMNCLRTGDRLSLEGEMVDRYKASRSSVREALRLLEVQGLIVLKPGPGGGPVVGQVDPANLARTASLYFHLGGATYESILRTQAMLEPLCTQLASRHPQRRMAMEPFVSPVCEAIGATRSTIQSPLAEDQLAVGIVAEAQPSADSTVVAAPVVVFLSTAGATELDAVQMVKWTRNGAFFPEESWSSPASVCGPGPSGPVP